MIISDISQRLQEANTLLATCRQYINIEKKAVYLQMFTSENLQ